MQQDIYRMVPAPDKLKPHVRRMMVGSTSEHAAFSRPAVPTGFPYLGWFTGTCMWADVDGERIELPNGVVHLSGQLYLENVTFGAHGPLVHVLAELSATASFELFGLDASAGKGKCHDICDQVPDLKTSVEHLNAQVSGPPDADAAVAAYCAFLETILTRYAPAPVSVSNAIELFERTSGRISVSDVVAKIGAPHRSFLRDFNKAVGLTPLQYRKIVQMNVLASVLMGESAPGLADIAQEAGFADQSHFTKAVAAFFSMTPTALLKDDSDIIEQFVRQSRAQSDTSETA